jgi:hypothetical protein
MKAIENHVCDNVAFPSYAGYWKSFQLRGYAGQHQCETDTNPCCNYWENIFGDNLPGKLFTIFSKNQPQNMIFYCLN